MTIWTSWHAERRFAEIGRERCFRQWIPEWPAECEVDGRGVDELGVDECGECDRVNVIAVNVNEANANEANANEVNANAVNGITSGNRAC